MLVRFKKSWADNHAAASAATRHPSRGRKRRHAASITRPQAPPRGIHHAAASAATRHPSRGRKRRHAASITRPQAPPRGIHHAAASAATRHPSRGRKRRHAASITRPQAPPRGIHHAARQTKPRRRTNDAAKTAGRIVAGPYRFKQTTPSLKRTTGRSGNTNAATAAGSAPRDRL